MSIIDDHFSHITYLMLETNSSCNLNCSFCNRGDLQEQGGRDPKNITIDEFEKVLSFFDGCPIDTVKIQGLSEPMLHPQFDLLAQMLRDKFKKAFVIIASNLQFDLEKSPFLSTLKNVDMVYLSIDGTKGCYESIRQGATYVRLIESLIAIRENVSLKDRSEKLFINFTVTKDNIRELPEMYRFKEEYGLAGVRINLAQNWNQEQENDHQFDSLFLNELKRYAKDVKGVAGWRYQDCFWPFSGVVIDVFGNVRQCVVNTSMEPIGNLFDTDIRTMFNESKVYKEARERLQVENPPSQCVTCDYKKLADVHHEIFAGTCSGDRPRIFAK